MNLNRESHTPTTSHVFCYVFESINIVEQISFPHALKLQFFYLEIFVVNPNTMLKTIIIDVDDEFVIASKKTKKVVNYKFQEIWVVKMPWAKPIFNEVGLVSTMKCRVCTIIERKEKKLVARWDFIDKHIGKRMGFDGKWTMDPKCMHVKNEISYAQLSITIFL
jgi:hypothetical protein